MGKIAKTNPADVARLAESPVPWRRVGRMFRPFAWELAGVALIIVVATTISLAQPFLLKLIIDDALPQGDTRLLVLSVAGMAIVAAATGFFGVWQTWLATKVGQRLMHTLRTQVFDHVQKQSMNFFKRTRGGEIQSRMTNDIAGLQAVVTSTATDIASNATAVIGTLIAIVILNPYLALITLVTLPPAMVVTRQVALKKRGFVSQRQKTMADLQSLVDESLTVSGAQLVRTLGIAPARSADFKERSLALSNLEVQARMAGRWRTAMMNLAFALVPACIYLAAGFPQFVGQVSIGTLVAFTSLQVAVFKPMMGLLNVGADWITSSALLSRIFGYLDLTIEVPEPTNPVDMPRETVRGDLVLNDVSYRYPDGDGDVISHVTLVVPAGGSAAIVGETGSGKSTVGSLIARLSDPTSGAISIDGVDVRDIRVEQLTAIIGVVSQETYMLHRTIRENLLIARPEATEEDIWKALAAAQVDSVIAALPEGLETVVGARGHRFSGGERQRLAIARTIIADPKILILDEATSALDPSTERELKSALDALSRGRTTVTIAHRLSTVRDVDQIHVLGMGEIVERGTYDELLLEGGLFAAMAASTESDDLAPVEDDYLRRVAAVALETSATGSGPRRLAGLPEPATLATVSDLPALSPARERRRA